MGDESAIARIRYGIEEVLFPIASPGALYLEDRYRCSQYLVYFPIKFDRFHL
jgi:hypothetical protein